MDSVTVLSKKNNQHNEILVTPMKSKTNLFTDRHEPVCASYQTSNEVTPQQAEPPDIVEMRSSVRLDGRDPKSTQRLGTRIVSAYCRKCSLAPKFTLVLL